jgi:radical SAM/Cys-rich protein
METQTDFAPPSFQSCLERHGLRIAKSRVTTLQINVGRRCNQTCRHCHVDAGPHREETLDSRTADQILNVLSRSLGIDTVDITGGAPELCSQFRRLITESARLKKKIIDRCNLTILFEPGQEDLAVFLRDHRVRVIASLPCYTDENVEKQRGRGVFGKSIDALRRLNELGYADPASGLELDLVYNPLGPSLPPPQGPLERDYKTRLWEDFGVRFNRLFTLTNMPIARFAEDLSRTGRTAEYMSLLARNFNAAATDALMCRTQVSVRWDGMLSDCDFNLMENLPLAGKRKTIWDLESFDQLNDSPIVFKEHCHACTAGAGSSCTGALVG